VQDEQVERTAPDDRPHDPAGHVRTSRRVVEHGRDDRLAVRAGVAVAVREAAHLDEPTPGASRAGSNPGGSSFRSSASRAGNDGVSSAEPWWKHGVLKDPASISSAVWATPSKNREPRMIASPGSLGSPRPLGRSALHASVLAREPARRGSGGLPSGE
jgi:hypothetical protein